MAATDLSPGRYERAFIAALAVGSLALRVYRIGDQSLWVDELLTLEVSSPKEGLNIWSYLKYNIHGPLHSAVVYLFQLVSSNEAWLRLPSALAGAAGVLYFYLWTRAWLGYRVARIAALLLALHPLHLHYSQELRNYSFLLLFGMMACYYFEKMTGCDRRGDRIGYVLTMSLAALSNFTAAYLYLIHTIVYFTRKGISRSVFARWAVLSLVVLMLLSPWVYRIYKFIDVSDLVTPVRLGQIEQTERLRGKTTITPAALPYALYTYSVGFSLGPSTRELHQDSSLRYVLRNYLPVVVWVMALFGGVFLWGAIAVARGRAPSRELFLYLFIPLIVTLLLNWQNAKAFNVRYVLIGYPAYVCFLAIGCDGAKRRLGMLLLFAMAATLLVADGHLYFNPKYAREDVRGAVRYVEEQISPGECILAPTVRGVVEYYYRGVEEVHSVYNPRGQPRQRVDRQLDAIFAWCNSLWYVRARPWVDDADGYVLARLADQYRELQVVDFEGVELIHYGPKKGVD